MHPESAQMIKVKPHRELWGFFNGQYMDADSYFWKTKKRPPKTKPRNAHPKQSLAPNHYLRQKKNI